MLYIGCYIVLKHYLTILLGAIPNLQIRKLRFRETKELTRGYVSNHNNNKDLLSVIWFRGLEDRLWSQDIQGLYLNSVTYLE